MTQKSNAFRAILILFRRLNLTGKDKKHLADDIRVLMKVFSEQGLAKLKDLLTKITLLKGLRIHSSEYNFTPIFVVNMINALITHNDLSEDKAPGIKDNLEREAEEGKLIQERDGKPELHLPITDNFSSLLLVLILQQFLGSLGNDDFTAMATAALLLLPGIPTRGEILEKAGALALKLKTDVKTWENKEPFTQINIISQDQLKLAITICNIKEQFVQFNMQSQQNLLTKKYYAQHINFLVSDISSLSSQEDQACAIYELIAQEQNFGQMGGLDGLICKCYPEVKLDSKENQNKKFDDLLRIFKEKIEKYDSNQTKKELLLSALAAITYYNSLNIPFSHKLRMAIKQINISIDELKNKPLYKSIGKPGKAGDILNEMRTELQKNQKNNGNINAMITLQPLQTELSKMKLDVDDTVTPVQRSNARATTPNVPTSQNQGSLFGDSKHAGDTSSYVPGTTPSSSAT